MPRLCEFYSGICLTTEEKTRKNVSKGKKNLSQVKKNLSHSTMLKAMLFLYGKLISKYVTFREFHAQFELE
jgi:hypothetical protein